MGGINDEINISAQEEEIVLPPEEVEQEAPQEIAQEEPQEIAQEEPQEIAQEEPEIVQEEPQEIAQEEPQEIAQEEPQEIVQEAEPSAPVQEAPKAGPPASEFIDNALSILERSDILQKEKSKLSGDVKTAEKAVTAMEKSIADSIAVSLRKTKEEIASTYDKELSLIQDKIDACKAERAKAKANAVAQRIQVETAPISQQNQEIESQIDVKFKENKVPAICKNRTASILFFPKRVTDWILDCAVAAVLLFLIPLFIVLSITSKPLLLTAVLFVYTAAIFAAYIYVLHRFMLKYEDVNKEVETLRSQIRVNNKNKQAVINKIKKSQDETGYDLASYDDEADGYRKQMQGTIEKRQEALDNFEKEVRHQIADDITQANKEDLESLKQDLEDKRQELKDKTQEIEETQKVIQTEYISVVGKDMMHKQKLNSLKNVCQNNPQLSVKEALREYKK